jgi:ethanolamine utilization protein EutP (predicted NTPase)
MPTPTFTQSTNFTFTFDKAALDTPATLIPHQQWYITGLYIGIDNLTVTSAAALALRLYDNGSTIFEAPFSQQQTGVISSFPNLVSMTNINLVSSGQGYLTAQLIFANLCSSYHIAINLFGGVLVN